MNTIEYCPEVFLPDNLEHAKDIILSSDPDREKWKRETDFTVTQMLGEFEKSGRPLNADSVVLDYGCGVGRVARELILRTGCTVVGADISPGMLNLSFSYVNSPLFIPCPQSRLTSLIRNGLRFDAAYSVWVLQHCEKPAEDISLVAGSLISGGPFYVVNMDERYLPARNTLTGNPEFVDDGIKVTELLKSLFAWESRLSFPSDSASARCAVYTK